MSAVQAYLPIDRRLAISASAALPDRVHGTALFADISGFTPLTAALYRELGSRRGAEALIAQLNRVYTALVAEVHGFGGAAINFSGDSMTCWFDDAYHGSEAASPVNGATRALACAYALQETMAGLRTVVTPGGTEIPLSLKVALSAGPARRFLAGDPGSYVLEVLAGKTLDLMAAGEELAHGGDIVVTAALLAELASPPAVAEWRRDERGEFAVLRGGSPPVARNPWPVVPSLPDDVVRPWTLPPVFAHLQHSSEAFLAELRTSVTMFVRFSGIDYEVDDEAGVKLNDYVCQLQEVLNRYEGYLLQITMGDKGGYLHASFGAPVAHEDDAQRAAAAALEVASLTEAVTYLEQPQIGISSGLVHSGAYGSPERSTYGVVGNDVNISARLMTTAAPGQILASAQVAEAIGGSFALESLPPVLLKGVAEPFPVWTLQKRHRAAAMNRPIAVERQVIGRNREQQLLDEALADLRDGQSSVMVIEGEAGVGKSLLTQELVRKATNGQSNGAALRVLAGYGDAIEQSSPYYAWRPIFEQAFGFDDRGRDDQSAGDWPDQVLAMLDADQRHLAPLLNVVLPFDLPETELTEQITGEARQDNIHQLLVSVLRRIAATNPLVLILDDAHWLDSVSWTLARRVQRDVAPLMLVLVTRPMGDEMPATFQALRQLPAARPLLLDTLAPAAIEELVSKRLGVASLPPQVAQLILSKAEGHPFFSEELAYALRDSGLIEAVDGQVRLVARPDELLALDFPNSIEGVITSRIDSLPPTEQLTVKVASVIGRIFPFRVLCDIYPVKRDIDLLRDNLTHLERLDITPLETPEPELTHFFRHILTQEVVYDLMTTSQKRQLHHEAAVWYEQASETDPGRFYPLIAHHYRQAGDRPQAAAYYGKAGENAFRDFANQEAIRFLELALELGSDTVPVLQRAHWHTLIGEASYRLTFMAKSQEHYRAALALLGYPLPESTGGRGFGLAGSVLRQVGHRQMPRRFVGSVPAEEREAVLEAARAYDGLAEVMYNEGDQLGSFYAVMATLNHAERAGPSPELIRSYANIATTFAIGTLYSLAEGYRQRALDMAAKDNDLATRAAIQIPFSVYSLWIGAWDRAEEEVAEALEIYGRLGEWRRWGVAAWVLPQVAQNKGQLARARDLWAELYDVAARNEDTRHQVRCRGGQFFNFLALDQPRDALICAEQVDVLLAENPEMVPVEERMWLGVRTTRELLRGNLPEARALALEQMEAISRAALKFDLLEVFAAPADVLLALWEQGAASPAEAAQGVKALSRYARMYPFARARADRLNGRAAWLSGKTDQAEKLWAKSLEQAVKLKMPLEQALTLGEMGQRMNRADYQTEATVLYARCCSDFGPPD